MFEQLDKLSPKFYGISLVPKSLWKDYGFVLLNISGSDGEVTDPELEWLTVSCAEGVGIDESIVKEWEEYDYDKDNLEDLFENISSSSFAIFNKLLIYDAVRMASADNDYAEDEQDQVYRAAKIMHVSPEVVTAIEALIDLENAADKIRKTIL